MHNWAINANVLRAKVKFALADWINNGYKNEFEAIAAKIDQMSARDLSLLKALYKDAFEKARLTGLASGSDFFYTSVMPAGFATSRGWTRFIFTNSDNSFYSKQSTQKWGASGSLSLGFFTSAARPAAAASSSGAAANVGQAGLTQAMDAPASAGVSRVSAGHAPGTVGPLRATSAAD